jgi:hypothetical protein
VRLPACPAQHALWQFLGFLIIPQPGAGQQGCRERRRLQQPWRSQVARPSRRATAMLVMRAMAVTRSQAGPPTKKGVHSPSLCKKEGRCTPSASPSSCLPLWKHPIIRETKSIRLVERGLARIAGQSCLAGPSVRSPVVFWCRSCSYHLLLQNVFNHTGTYSPCLLQGRARVCRPPPVSVRLPSMRIVSAVGSRRVPMPGKSPDRAIVRRTAVERKPF